MNVPLACRFQVDFHHMQARVSRRYVADVRGHSPGDPGGRSPPILPGAGERLNLPTSTRASVTKCVSPVTLQHVR